MNRSFPLRAVITALLFFLAACSGNGDPKKASREARPVARPREEAQRLFAGVQLVEDSDRATTFEERSDAGEKFDRYEYGRYGNPTVEAAAERIAALEGAEAALLFSSGMAAVLILR